MSLAIVSALIIDFFVYAWRMNAVSAGAPVAAEFFVVTKIGAVRNSWRVYAFISFVTIAWGFGATAYRICTGHRLTYAADVIFAYSFASSLVVRITLDRFWRRQLEANTRDLPVRVPEYV